MMVPIFQRSKEECSTKRMVALTGIMSTKSSSTMRMTWREVNNIMMARAMDSKYMSIITSLTVLAGTQ